MIRHSFLVLICVAMMAFAIPTLSSSFEDDLKRVDEAITTNPSGAMRQTLESCLRQRNFAFELQKMGMVTRAERALKYCFDTLQIPTSDAAEKALARTEKELQIKANREYERALKLTPDLANGLAIYRECAACHEPEGWGRPLGGIPQIAGQHRHVVIKQLADFRAGNRESARMVPYASVEYIGGTQAVADVTAYISTLEINIDIGHGSGSNLELGKALYQEHCAGCHGDNGEGSNDDLVPRIQAQHYRYLLRQFKWIRDGKRRNANAEMVAIIEQLDDREMEAVLDYSSRLLPAEELRAPEGWKNPDFK
jgi:cytochrome c553